MDYWRTRRYLELDLVKKIKTHKYTLVLGLSGRGPTVKCFPTCSGCLGHAAAEGWSRNAPVVFTLLRWIWEGANSQVGIVEDTEPAFYMLIYFDMSQSYALLSIAVWKYHCQKESFKYGCGCSGMSRRSPVVVPTSFDLSSTMFFVGRLSIASPSNSSSNNGSISTSIPTVFSGETVLRIQTFRKPCRCDILFRVENKLGPSPPVFA